MLIVGMWLCNPDLSYGYTKSYADKPVITPTSTTLKVTSIFPPDGYALRHFPANLTIQVTRGGIPEEGARVQFWMLGGSHDSNMHNAFLTVTDSSGYAYLRLLNQNILESGPYMWYASAIKPGFRGAASDVMIFYNSLSDDKKITSLGGVSSTDKKQYFIGQDSDVKIYGNASHYHLGEPIIIKITEPSGKTVTLVEYGTYLGAFQTIYKLGPNSKSGSYAVTVYHFHVVSSTCSFYVIK